MTIIRKKNLGSVINSLSESLTCISSVIWKKIRERRTWLNENNWKNTLKKLGYTLIVISLSLIYSAPTSFSSLPAVDCPMSRSFLLQPPSQIKLKKRNRRWFGAARTLKDGRRRAATVTLDDERGLSRTGPIVGSESYDLIVKKSSTKVCAYRFPHWLGNRARWKKWPSSCSSAV